MAQEANHHRPAAPHSTSSGLGSHSLYYDQSSSLPEVVDNFQNNNTHRFVHLSGDPGKEVERPDGKERAEDLAYGLPMSQNGYHNSGDAFEAHKYPPNLSSKEKSLRILGRVCAVVVLVVVLALALGLGLGLGLKTDKAAPPEAAHSVNPEYLSTRGAFNGTGISVMQQPYQLNLTMPESLTGQKSDDGNLLLVFQHHTSEIRLMQRDTTGSWRGGSAYDVVATDAKNATPIALLGGGPKGVQQHHVFYISEDNHLRQRFIDNQTYKWYDGPLNGLNIQTLDSDRVGLQACFYQGPIAGVDLNGTDPTTGIRIFVATDETTFAQYAWRSGLPSWVQEPSNWQSMNGHASPACFGWAAGWTTYVMFVDNQNTIQMYWRDTSYSVESSPTHPLNTWEQSSISFPTVDPNTGLSFHGNLYSKEPDSGHIQGWNITWAAENTTTGSTTLSNVIGDPAIDNTHLYAWTIPPVGGDDEMLIFYQTEGDDITMVSGDPTTGQWTSTTIPIPSD